MALPGFTRQKWKRKILSFLQFIDEKQSTLGPFLVSEFSRNTSFFILKVSNRAKDTQGISEEKNMVRLLV